MKRLIHSVPADDGSKYELFAEFSSVLRPQEFKQLVFTGVSTNSSGEETVDVKGQFFLPPEAVQNLKSLIESI
jgi:hypothetical protein